MMKSTCPSQIFFTFLRFVLIFFPLLSIALNLSAASDEWLNVALTGKPVTCEPQAVGDAVSLAVIHNNVFESLVRYGKQRLVLEPALAVSWKVEQAGKVWVFTLRDGVLFHDGSSLTSDDVIDSFGKNPFFKGRMERVDRLRVRCILPDKRAGCLKTMSQVHYAISKTLPDGSIVGTGPFVLSEWNPSNRVILETFKDYWGKRSALGGVTFHCSMKVSDALSLMRQGEIDFIDIVPPSLADEIEADDELVLSVLEGVNVSFININTHRSPLGEPEFRRALNLAINREEIIRDVYFGHAISCRGLLPPAIGGDEEGPPKIAYEPREAKDIIKKYMDRENRIFKMAGLPFSRPYCPEPYALARLVIRYLEKAGLKIEYYQPDTWIPREDRGVYDFIIAGWVLDSRNPDDFFTNTLGIGGVDTFLGSLWRNELFESLLLQARTTVSVRKRWQLYRQADDIFFEEYPWILLIHTNQLCAYRKGIMGFISSPTGELRLGEVSKNTGN
jgi:peptide/nickel transport system substrate-binding protein